MDRDDQTSRELALAGLVCREMTMKWGGRHVKSRKGVLVSLVLPCLSMKTVYNTGTCTSVSHQSVSWYEYLYRFYAYRERKAPALRQSAVRAVRRLLNLLWSFVCSLSCKQITTQRRCRHNSDTSPASTRSHAPITTMARIEEVSSSDGAVRPTSEEKGLCSMISCLAGF